MISADPEIPKILRDSVRGVLDRHKPIGVSDVSPTDGYDEDLWRHMGELGWPGALGSAEHDGTELGMAAAAYIVEELAYHNTCVPFISSAVMALSALEAGDPGIAAETVPALVSGKRIAAYCCTGSNGTINPDLINVVARPTTGDGVLTLDGSASFVLDAAFADLLIVVARRESGGLCVVHLPSDARGVVITPVSTINRGHQLANVWLSNVAIPAGSVIAAGSAAASLFERVQARGLVAVAADAHGAARCAFDLARDYAVQRRQFGRVIGSFQAIKHELADMYTLLTASAACVRAAAVALDDNDPQATRRVATAASYVREAASQIAGTSMQLHGAVGYTWALSCHLALKRAKFGECYLITGWDARDRLAGLALDAAADRNATADRKVIR